jgi:quercetin dioxygenase-like cupin family protein
MHTDERGTIKDLLVTEKSSVTHVTFKKGAVRGNHYHKKTIQHDIVLKGRLKCVYETDYSKYSTVVTEGEQITHHPGVPHAYKALENSEIVSICYGVRVGEDYKKDTFKLKSRLIQ